MGAAKTVDKDVREIVPGNVIRLRAGKGVTRWLRVTSVEAYAEPTGEVQVTTREGRLEAKKFVVNGTPYVVRGESEDPTEMSIVLLGDFVVHVRLKRVRVVYLKNGETLEFVRNANIRMANWLRARDINGRVRTVYTSEILRKDWEYRPIV